MKVLECTFMHGNFIPLISKTVIFENNIITNLFLSPTRYLIFLFSAKNKNNIREKKWITKINSVTDYK